MNAAPPIVGPAEPMSNIMLPVHTGVFPLCDPMASVSSQQLSIHCPVVLSYTNALRLANMIIWRPVQSGANPGCPGPLAMDLHVSVVGLYAAPSPNAISLLPV